MKRLQLPLLRSDEFADGASELDGASRREFIKLMGASLALAGLSGCRRPAENILPYGHRPEDLVPGRPQRYASAMPFAGGALGVVVESHEGRPTKIEGNPLHPSSLGGASPFAQASLLELYDPDRSRGPRSGGAYRAWSDAVTALRAALDGLGDGRGLAVVTEAHRSPTLAAQLAALQARFPPARVVRYEPFAPGNARLGAELAFGRALEPSYDLGRARVIAALDADLLQSPRHARGWAEGRKRPAGRMNRLYSLESRFSITGATADHRLRTRAARVHALALALAHAVGVDGLPAAPALDAYEARFVAALAADLKRDAGAGLAVAGDAQPPAVHALAHAINFALQSKSVRWLPPFASGPEGPAALVSLAQSMARGDVKVLLMLGGNPVFDAPADADFAAALDKVPLSAHLSLYYDETSRAATWHLNRAHWLEAWSDVRAEDGTLSVVQPLIAPLHGGRTDAELLERLLGGERTAYQLASANFTFASGLKRALHDGLAADSAPPDETPRLQLDARTLAAPPPSTELELTFHPDVHAYDGRFANNGWLQELPDPMTKLTWDSAALIAPATARRLDVTDGDIVELRVAERVARVPVLTAPGQAEGSIAVSVGQGRRHAGVVGDGVGCDLYPLRTATAPGFTTVTLVRTGERRQLAVTHGHHKLEGRPLIRQATPQELAKDPELARKPDEEHPPLDSLWKEHEYHGHKWGLTIDLARCTGCNACTVACQAENNVPIVGRSGVLRSREMHWIRVDRYFTDGDDPESMAQPIACQQCEQAPCEQVCPAGATTHSPEGLNDMAYNRCVGTRYCANNCPYKVRRFNFFNYMKDLTELRKMQFNPDVTVRSRGVMEKCTYCVQRINAAKIEAHKAGRERVSDGEIVTACQQTCPTQAITFGDLNDRESAIARTHEDERRYVLLEELNLKPRTSFLVRVRNPNPELG